MTDKERMNWQGWETVGLIGRGSFGDVYEIKRDVFDDTEKAALKIISIPQNSKDIEEMYNDGYDEESVTGAFESHLKSILAEYTLMRKMSDCVNIVRCDDVNYEHHEDGIGWNIFIRMELLTPLTKALPVTIPEETVIKLAKDICNALDCCKKYNVIHRDIKPQNIFVSENGDYKLGDFGIAKTVEKTMGGTKIGTYKYMAPEVYNNQPYGSAADIYSLGLVLYWMLNNRRMPFVAANSSKMTVGIEEESRNRRLSGEKLPEPANGSKELKAIVMKACAYNPKDRYSSAREMLDELNELGKEHIEISEPLFVNNILFDPQDENVDENGTEDNNGFILPFEEKYESEMDTVSVDDKGSIWEMDTKEKTRNDKPKKAIIICVCAIVLAVLVFLGVENYGGNSDYSEDYGGEYSEEEQYEDVQQDDGSMDWVDENPIENDELDPTGDNWSSNENTEADESTNSDKNDNEETEKGNVDNNETVINGEVPIASGKCGTSVSWEYYESTGKLKIFGAGKMTDYSFDNRPWEDYEGVIKQVIIEKGVSSIGKYAFYHCELLANITIPNSVKTIGTMAFANCRALSNVEMPNSITTIGSNAFEYCSSLLKLTIPDSVTTIGDWAFRGCKSLSSVTLSKNITEIKVRVFSDCSSLKKITLPKGVTSIGNYAFYSCSSLESITIPGSVSSIGNYAFDYCNSLKTVYYSGTSTHWNAILKGSNNQKLTNATVNCTLTGPSLALKTNRTTVSAGDTVTVLVVLSEKSNLGTLVFDVNYDSSAFEIVSMTCSDLISGGVVNPNFSSNSARYTVASANAINSGGTVVTIKFKVKSSKNSKMTINVNEATNDSYNEVTLHTNEISFTAK